MRKGEMTMEQLMLIVIALAVLAIGLLMIGGFRESLLSLLSRILGFGR
jgi:hypothetical protein